MKILVPIDGSKYSMAALDVAVDFAKTKGASVDLINVMPYIEAVDLEISAHDREKVNKSMEKRADDLVQNACGFLSGNDVTATCRHIVASTSIPDAIIDYAEHEKTDLIIIGSKGLSQSSRFKMGSVAAKVVKHSPCSVYVVKL